MPLPPAAADPNRPAAAASAAVWIYSLGGGKLCEAEAPFNDWPSAGCTDTCGTSQGSRSPSPTQLYHMPYSCKAPVAAHTQLTTPCSPKPPHQHPLPPNLHYTTENCELCPSCNGAPTCCVRQRGRQRCRELAHLPQQVARQGAPRGAPALVREHGGAPPRRLPALTLAGEGQIQQRQVLQGRSTVRLDMWTCTRCLSKSLTSLWATLCPQPSYGTRLPVAPLAKGQCSIAYWPVLPRL